MQTLTDFWVFNRNHIYLTIVAAALFPIVHDLSAMGWRRLKGYIKSLKR